MNLPNKLTVIRIILVPIFLFFFYLTIMPHNYFVALVVFSAASLTDLYDGKIARERGLVTNFGKLMDPLADKMLVSAAFIAFVGVNFASAIAVIIIISREFLVTSLRLIAVESGNVIAAGKLGKIKTVTQIVAILLILFLREWLYLELPLIGETLVGILSGIAVWVATAFTIVSGVEYVAQNMKYINMK